MRIGGIQPGMGMGSETEGIRRQLQMLKQELGRLNAKQELTEEERARKEKIERQIEQLERRLQNNREEAQAQQ